ncbi:MAG TPA: RNB domain-containing ribonuclease [Terriglobia bacterium]|nr:RNB domain-containing ribonuclease [Terriglobia bacterium]
MSRDLRTIAERAMQARGFLVRFPEEVHKELSNAHEPPFDSLKIRDLSSWLWSSIDNDDSRDLDQIEYVQNEAKGTRVYVGIADVDWFVPLRSALDRAAAQNTTSVYTGVETFMMLPEGLSTDLSSLNEGGKRLAMIAEMLVAPDGSVLESMNYPAIVENKAQLTYDAVAAWLEGKTETGISEAGHRTLDKINKSAELQTQIKLQDETAQMLRVRRHEAGALSFNTQELRPVMSPEGSVLDLETRQQNRASYIIEDFMIASNQATAGFLDTKNFPSIRRVVRVPARWDRIVALAASLGGSLPGEPDGGALEDFLQAQQRSSPSHFGDLSLAIIKLLGRGEYVVKMPGDEAPGHFGLAVQNYSHSTAPNRRYPDLITQRLLKAAIAGQKIPYSASELDALARHCTEKEDDANKVERFVRKCAAATLLMSRIGQKFSAVVSGVSRDGTWVRLSHPPVEGKLAGPPPNLDVGDRVKVQLISANPEKGFIDFELV